MKFGLSNYDPAFPHRTSVEKPRCHDDETLSHQGEELTPFRAIPTRISMEIASAYSRRIR